MLSVLKSLWRRFERRGAAGTSGKHAADIARNGWSGMYVGDYRTAPTWAYTIGFAETLGQPEVIVFDVPQDAANALLWEAFTQLKEGRLTLADGRVWPEDTERPGVWRKVERSQLESEEGWFTFAMLRSLERSGAPYAFEAFQLVLADSAGRLPWENGYDERLRPRQPALYLPLASEATALASGPAV